MMKKVISVALLVGVMGIAAWLYFRVYQGISQKKQTEARSQQLPAVRLLGLDSTAFLLKKAQQSTIVFYFDPHCEHCQHEANALKKQAVPFENTTLLWLSTERLWVLRDFEEEYGLQKQFPLLKIAQISPQDADKQFGFRTVPTILIYGADGQLIKKYVGETKMEAIVKHLDPL